MNKQNQILVGKFDGFAWIRCDGKGSFANSPQMKQWADTQITSGKLCIVIDLESCTAMDSTFMGTMAGIALRLSKLSNGVLQIADANEKSRNSLEDLGLSMLLEINPTNAIWSSEIENIRNSLVNPSVNGIVDKTQHVYDAHNTLCETDEGNNEKFSTVLDVLEAELANRNKLDQ